MSPTIQEEIKQGKPFPHLPAEALVAIVRTAAVLDHALADALRPFGVTPTQYNVLRILRGAGVGGLCGREVGERLISQVPDVSRLLDRMDDLGLITRERDEADRRHVTARVSSRGLRILEDAGPVLREMEERWFAAIPADRVRELLDLLDTIRNPR